MHRLLILLLFAFAAMPAVAQQDDADASEATESSDASSPDAAEPDAEIDADEDDPDELYTDDDDRFIPSEDVKFGQSIPFPTDI